jgi:hypothetical protein
LRDGAEQLADLRTSTQGLLVVEELLLACVAARRGVGLGHAAGVNPMSSTVEARLALSSTASTPATTRA